MRIALCIGINKYLNSPNINLEYACLDASEIAKILSDPDRGGFEEVIVLQDQYADKLGIQHSLRNILLEREFQSEDLIVIYFSGHGTLDKAEKLLLVPHDINFLSNGEIDPTTALHLNELEIILDNTSARQLVLILDACHSGGASKLLGKLKYQDDRNLVIVGASRFSEKAWESPENQHGRFTHHFIENLNQNPTIGEWLTLSQVLDGVYRGMNEESDKQHLEVSSHTINPSILIAKNHLFTKFSVDLVQSTKKLCQLAGSQIINNQFIKAYPFLFVIREFRSFGRYDDTLVICQDNRNVQITEQDIENYNHLFNYFRNRINVSTALLILRIELPAELRTKLSSFIHLHTKFDLLRSLLDFTSYLTHTVEEFESIDPSRPEEPTLGKYYVELRAKPRITMHEFISELVNKNDIDLGENTGLKTKYLKVLDRLIKLTQNTSSSSEIKSINKKILQTLYYYETKERQVSEVVSEFLEDPHSRALFVLGGYGTGKTSMAHKIAYDLAIKLLNKDDSKTRIPVIFPLRRFPRVAAVDIEPAIIAHLKQHCGVNNPDYRALQEMNNEGILLLIFDGFDEMAVQASEDVIRKNFFELTRFAMSANAKIIITSRPEVFISDQEEQNTVTLDDNSISLPMPSIQRIELLPFNKQQIEEYLKKRIPLIESVSNNPKGWEYYEQQINQTIGLKNLITRPVLLEMTITTLPKLLERRGAVTKVNLYDTYLRGEIDRQQILKGRQMLISDRRERLSLVQKIAEYMYLNDQIEITAEQIQSTIVSQLSKSQRKYIESYLRDFLALSFLSRDGDQYRFSHLSFLEYLIASAMASEIRENNNRLLKSRKLNSAIIEFLIELATEEIDDWEKKLNAWIAATRGTTKQNSQFLGGNAVTLLNSLGIDIKGSDYSETVLAGANLSNCNCCKISFRSAVLDDADFSSAQLDDVDFRNSSLTNAVFGQNKINSQILNAEQFWDYVDNSGAFENAATAKITSDDPEYQLNRMRRIISEMGETQHDELMKKLDTVLIANPSIKQCFSAKNHFTFLEYLVERVIVRDDE